MNMHHSVELYSTGDSTPKKWNPPSGKVERVGGSRRDPLIERLRVAIATHTEQGQVVVLRDPKGESPIQIMWYAPGMGRERSDDEIIDLLNMLTCTKKGDKNAVDITHETRFDVQIRQPIEKTIDPQVSNKRRPLGQKMNAKELHELLWQLAESFQFEGELGPAWSLEIWADGQIVGTASRSNSLWHIQVSTARVKKRECWGYKEKLPAFMELVHLISTGYRLVKIAIMGPNQGILLKRSFRIDNQHAVKQMWEIAKKMLVFKDISIEYKIGEETKVEQFTTEEELNKIWTEIGTEVEEFERADHQRWLKETGRAK